ncbi:hypothetical protein ABKV19_014722 [Rosa sericea]
MNSAHKEPRSKEIYQRGPTRKPIGLQFGQPIQSPGFGSLIAPSPKSKSRIISTHLLSSRVPSFPQGYQ